MALQVWAPFFPSGDALSLSDEVESRFSGYARSAKASLACSSDIRDPDRGTARVQWADANKSNEGAAVLALLEGNGITLNIACKQVDFTGRWGELPDGTLGFVGRYVSPDAPGDGQPAIVRLRLTPAEPEAVGQLLVEDASGSALFGPWGVRRVEGAVTFAACGP